MSSQNRNRAIAGILTLGLLTGCAGTPLGDGVQQSLEADPQLEEAPAFEDDAVESPAEGETETDTASAQNENSTQTALETGNDAARTAAPDDAPEPGDPAFIGPVRPDAEMTESATSEPSAASESLTGVPADLQSYIRDLQALEVVTLSQSSGEGADNTNAAERSPFVQTISRREYARWLFESYNAIYADEPGDRLRPGSSTDEPAFQDVSSSNPDFAAIQGLAEAGIIPSAFTGNSTDVNFRPDAPLTRADLILWKVPLDTQAALPSTTPEAVNKSWGFQDTASINPLALRAIAADFQLDDFANFRRAFGYTTLFRPDKAVTRAEAAAVLWRYGTITDGITAAEAAKTADADEPE